MRLLLLTLGSHGDIHPFFALAQALQAAGHEPLVATNPYFEAQARRANIPFVALTEHADIAEIMQRPGVMHPMRGARVVLQELTLPLVPEIYRSSAEILRTFRPDAAIIHPIVLGSHWACEKAGVPIITVALAPISWMGSSDRIVFGPWRSYDPPHWLTRVDAWVGRHMIRWMLDGTLNRMRRDVGLPKQRDILIAEFTRPGLNLGLWSTHFRPPAQGDPVGGVITGFPFFDAHHDHEHNDPALERFLNDGEPPIIFAQGTTAVHIRSEFYDHAVAACQALGRRGVLLIGREDYRPLLPSLPPTVHAVTYAPFSELLPRGCATVHHGGIGSTAQGLRSGKPTVITPLAHDQFDNAARAKRLGTSDTVFRSRLSAKTLTQALRHTLENPAIPAKANEIGKKMRSEHAPAVFVPAIEKWLGMAKNANSLAP